MMQSSWTQSAVIDAPDLSVQPQTNGNGVGHDFTFEVYTQLAQIHHDIGALTTAQAKLDIYVKESEVRFSELARESELRLSKLGEESEKRLTQRVRESEERLTQRGRESEERLTQWSRESEERLTQWSRASEERLAKRVEKLETGALERVKTTEDKLSSLKDFVHRLFWMGTGIVAVLGVTLGWKPIWLWIATTSL
jgi:ElaB/YqjD/DUF883 family membrane-anchored ribosome-binding protein